MRILLLLTLALTLLACGGPTPTYVRGDEIAGLDDPAMGVGLDRADLQTFFDEHMHDFYASNWYELLDTADQFPGPTVAILPMENQTTEHLDSQLNWFIGLVETELVNTGVFTVVAQQMRDQILEELEMQQGDAFDQARAVAVGNQLGVRYFVTGRVMDNSERTANARRVQYTMILQVLDVETGAIAWQNQEDLTKALIPLD